ncbi:MAG: hypothetical protein HC925_07865 [Coleofasciculaceae cyanobacterium SM2_3_26]|nr:hypothetical protein [Coleofasciculaceae cyanobacterium SM2_3_26]
MSTPSAADKGAPLQPMTRNNQPASESGARASLVPRRPIGSSTLKVKSTYMHNRPIASNQTEDTETMLGYLD